MAKQRARKTSNKPPPTSEWLEKESFRFVHLADLTAKQRRVLAASVLPECADMYNNDRAKLAKVTPQYYRLMLRGEGFDDLQAKAGRIILRGCAPAVANAYMAYAKEGYPQVAEKLLQQARWLDKPESNKSESKGDTHIHGDVNVTTTIQTEVAKQVDNLKDRFGRVGDVTR